MRNYLISLCCSILIVSCTWFPLWVISTYFTTSDQLAVLLFPFALRLGVCLLSPIQFWPGVYLCEWVLMAVIADLLGQPEWQFAELASVLSLPALFIAKHYFDGPEWKRLSIIGGLVIFTAVINMLSYSPTGQSAWMVLLVSITGGLMVVPACYLVWDYLFARNWLPLTSGLAGNRVSLRVGQTAQYALLLVLSLFAQVGLPGELRIFAPFCLAIPIVLLAFSYGWQGALLGTLLNSVALIAAGTHESALHSTDLLLTLSAQSLTGILLGIGIQRQRELNRALHAQLKRNRKLSTQLVEAEEAVRRNVARELHDDIGQNITAIRTQASILKRIEQSDMGNHCANTIEQLSLNIYDTTRHLLSQLRPKVLDDLPLKDAVIQLTRDLEFDRQGISCEVEWTQSEEPLTDTMRVTIYRLCQEALNNVAKHANASTIKVIVKISLRCEITVVDDGVGIDAPPAVRVMALKGCRKGSMPWGECFPFVHNPGTAVQ